MTLFKTLCKTLIFILVLPATVTVYLPYWLLAARPATAQLAAFRYAGLLPILLGVGVNLWCAWDFAVTGRGTPAPLDPPKELVARGLYARVRVVEKSSGIVNNRELWSLSFSNVTTAAATS